MLPLFLLPAGIVSAEMLPMGEFELSRVSGQGGVYLSGEFAINKEGGPLWEDGTRPYYTRDAQGNLTVDSDTSADECSNDVCGLRLAIKLNENSEGWYVVDDLSGGLAFDGLTLQTETLETVTNYDVWENGDFQQKDVDDEVLKIGLPGTISFNDFKFKFAVANNGEFGVPLADGTAFRQTEIFGVQLNGDITVGGNLLLFPVD